MGADGSVTVYRVDDLERVYAEQNPDGDLYADWPYLRTITGTLDGVRWVFDYASTGNGATSENSFYFDGEWVPVPDDLRGVVDEQIDWKTKLRGAPAGMIRVHRVLQAVGPVTEVEVWT